MAKGKGKEAESAGSVQRGSGAAAGDSWHNREHLWGSKELAEAFAEGVEYVNDSAIEVIGIEPKDGAWAVLIFDEDKEFEPVEKFDYRK